MRMSPLASFKEGVQSSNQVQYQPVNNTDLEQAEGDLYTQSINIGTSSHSSKTPQDAIPALASFNLQNLLRKLIMLFSVFFVGFLIILSVRVFIIPDLIALLKSNSKIIFEPTRPVQGRLGGVASEHKTCSLIGTQILQEGGSAIDASIGGALCVGVVNGFSSGIGGGGFMMIRDSNGFVEVIDFREVAPAATDFNDYIKNPSSTMVGGLSVGVPGEIRGMEIAHQRYGKLPWARLFQPSIQLAKEGFPVGTALYKHMKDHANDIYKSAALSQVYTINGTLAKEGTIIYRRNLGITLASIAKHGANYFYEGEFAAKTINTLQKHGSVMAVKDLKDYRPVLREPLIADIGGNKIYTTPAPTSGAVLLAILNTLNGYPPSRDSVLHNHRFIEALKYGFALRTQIADPDFVPGVKDFLEEIISLEFAEKLRKNISDFRTYDYKHYNPKYATKELPGTTHLSAIDAEGMAVALTSTVNLIFGSKLMDPDSGILFNNQMDDFSIPNVRNDFDLYPSPDNFIVPNKRPLSSTVPTIVEGSSGELLAIGGSGGSRILSAVAQVLLRHLNSPGSLAEALDTPRLHHQLLPNTIYLESGFCPIAAKALQNMGHSIEWWYAPKTAIQAVYRSESGLLTAVSDGRKHGLAAAY